MATDDLAGAHATARPVHLLVLADRTRCVGSGMCALTAPEVFDQDEEEGLVVLLRARLTHPSPHADAAREAGGLCPAEAIRVG
ncbi:ferredoxin (plasmid) [Streptomyces sp. CA-294286]|uniref:ferredoxin n=1 Tax=Streptomyces sp. CA-294286 TaxID=3240070 RepID=UPI003D94CC4E